MHRTCTILGILFTCFAVTPADLYADGVDFQVTPDRPYYLEIDKSERLLRVKFAGNTYKQYHIAYGRGEAGGKQLLGDRRTPEGIYRIAGFNPRSQFHFFIRLNYPNVKDAFAGLHNKIISESEFSQIIDSLKFGKLPPQNTALGGAIGIHGIGLETADKLKIHSGLNWTKGCVALTNDGISSLRRYVALGTEVVIKE